jgi:hypothetical protein
MSIFKCFCTNGCPESVATATADVFQEGNIGFKMSRKIGKIMKIFDWLGLQFPRPQAAIAKYLHTDIIKFSNLIFPALKHM